jgi:peptide-methionine (S)-S-oxide reductase
MEGLEKIGFGGSCHWCTEAVFQSVIGVEKVDQGWISPSDDLELFSEAVLVYFDPAAISVSTLLAIHLYSHSSTASHSMRSKYRSAVYVFDEVQGGEVKQALTAVEQELGGTVITQVLTFGAFTLNSAEFLDYYATDPDRPFCKTYIEPKLKALVLRFSGQMKIALPENK